MSIFSGYEKMAESVAAWQLDPAGFRSFRRVPWAVTEKIHGANFCFVIEAGQVRGASRRRLLDETEGFFGWQTVRDTLAAGLRAATAQVMEAEAEPIERVCVYGELFGGGYPHPDVSPVPNVSPVQTGVWYAPDIRFAAFDMSIEGSQGRRYLDFERTQAVLRAAGVPCITPLRVGTYEQATDFPVRFDSTIPATLGLPPLPAGSNLAEGIVVRPVRELVVVGQSGPVRPLLKQKIAEFAEDKRFHGAERWEEPDTRRSSTGEPLDLLKWEAYCRITENRLDAALSKVGPRPPRNRKSWARELFVLLETEIQEEALATQHDLGVSVSGIARIEWDGYVRDELRRLIRGRFRSSP